MNRRHVTMVKRIGWILALLGSSTAWAQSAAPGGIDGHGFNLAAFDGDLRDPLTVHRPGRFEAWDFFAGTLGEFAESPLVFYTENRDGEIYDSQVALDDVYATNFDFGVSPLKWLRVDLAVPVFYASRGTAGPQGMSVGDLRFTALAALIRPDIDDQGFGLGISGHVDAPSGAQADFLGSEQVSGGGRVTGSYAWEKLTLAADLGLQGNPEIVNVNLNGSDALIAGLSLGTLVGARTGVTVEGRYKAPIFANDVAGTGAPGEVLLHGRHRLKSGVFFALGGAAGLTDGAGAAVYRIFGGLGYGRLGKPPAPKDTDGDGFLDSQDLCPKEPEDRDGFQDFDGCPDDNQRLTVKVQTTEGEALDAVVTISSSSLSEDLKTASADVIPGFYDLNVEVDGYDPIVRQVEVPAGEDLTEVISLEPLPKAGAVIVKVFNPDGQRVDATLLIDENTSPTVNGVLEQPLLAGDYTVEARAEGYAVKTATFSVVAEETTEVRIDLAPTQVELTRERIELRDSVYFDTAKASIKSQSLVLLDEVAQIMADHPEILVLRIEGHTDSRGSAAYNLQLSKDRAASVRTYLIEKGVSADRLVSEGFGETRPLDKRQTAAAYEKNRRVDFFIQERSD